MFSIDASPLDPATAYAAIDLHRLDRRAPLLLRTHDAGRTWTVITDGLPRDEITSVVRTDPVAEGLLFAGTDRAVYVSFDDGGSWQELSNGLPSTWMRDLLPHAGDLIVATQGRGLWVLDDVALLREAREAAGRDVHLFTPTVATRLRSSESHDTPWPPETALGQNPPSGAVLDYWLRSAPRGPVTLTITDAAGALVRRFSSADEPESSSSNRYFEKAWIGELQRLEATPGAHRFVWDLRYPRPQALDFHYSIAAIRTEGTPLEPLGAFVLPGRYTVTLTVDGVSMSRPLTVRVDPRVRAGSTALQAQLELARACESSLARAVPACRAMRQQRDGAGRGTALADSLAAIADAPQIGLASVCSTIARLMEGIEAADAAPSQGMRDALADCDRRAEALLERWHALDAAGVPEKQHATGR